MEDILEKIHNIRKMLVKADKELYKLENLTKHNNDFKKVCSKCGHELSEYSILEDGLCNQCTVGMNRKLISKS